MKYLKTYENEFSKTSTPASDMDELKKIIKSFNIDTKNFNL